MCMAEDIVALVDWKDAMWFLGAMGLWLLSDIFEHYYRRRGRKGRRHSLNALCLPT